MAATLVYLLRHGETEWNLEGRLQGHRDSALSAHGLEQVAALGRRLANEPLSAIYTSDLGRAVTTARAVAGTRHAAPLLDARLRERALGVFEGLTREEARAQHPELYAAHESHAADFKLPGGQSLREHQQQSLDVARELAQRHIGQTIALVTHGGALSAVFRASVGVSLETPRRFSLGNAAVNLFELHGEHFKLVTWGDAQHLPARTNADTRMDAGVGLY